MTNTKSVTPGTVFKTNVCLCVGWTRKHLNIVNKVQRTGAIHTWIEVTYPNEKSVKGEGSVEVKKFRNMQRACEYYESLP